MDLLQSLVRPSEAVALVQFKSKYGSTKRGGASSGQLDENLQYCYDSLFKTSRSFAMVIADLGDSLRDSICIFYLTLRALDTVEDDMDFDIDRKRAMLPEFYTYLNDPDWSFAGCGKGDEQALLAQFYHVTRAFQALDPKFQPVILDITKRMGEGMCEFINKMRVGTLQEWDTYCYYVAGLVGIGLSKLFTLSGLEDSSVSSAEAEAISMGLFLQKTNITRDFLEDIIEGRIFWPEEVWSRYTSKLDNFRDAAYSKEAVQCLNHLITNALAHIPDCLEYLTKIKDTQNFAFCAIPQVMAMATLSLCYNNPDVFTQKVKIRRGESARIAVGVSDNTNNILGVHALFYEYAQVLADKIPADDPNSANTRALVEKVKALTRVGYETHTPQSDKTAWTLTVTGAIALATTVSFLF